MLIEQIIGLQLRGAGPHDCTCTPINGYFRDKTKISKTNFREDYYLLLKYSRGNVPCFPLPWPYHLQLKFRTKMQGVKRVLDLNCKQKGRLNNLNFSIGFQMSKI